ncbi:MAG: CDGSH iron-sulfur domain-containing protein [Lutibacter sp.]
MELPKKAGNEPIKVNLQKDKKYAWCSCGLSENQPLCDGKHKGTEFAPKVFNCSESSESYLCTCKHTKNEPYCDGSHKLC